MLMAIERLRTVSQLCRRGEPLDDENSPKDEFEKTAVKQLKAGKPWYDNVIVLPIDARF